jgi:hypothetical protein
MSQPEGLLSKRPALALVLILCLVASVWSWILIAKGVRHGEGLVNVLFFAVGIIISISIAYRSRFWPDRLVFGAIASAFALVVVRAAPLLPGVRLAVDVSHASMWTIAALASLIVLGTRRG